MRLTGLGKIVSQQVQIDDLQGQVDELTKRETALRGQIARLSARLTGTDLDAETRATLEARRDAARAELARVRTTRAQVNGEARYATIQLTLQTPQSAVVPATPSRWDDAVDRGVGILAVEAMVVLYALVIVGPLALLALLVWLGPARAAAAAERAAALGAVMPGAESLRRPRPGRHPAEASSVTGSGVGWPTRPPTSTVRPVSAARRIARATPTTWRPSSPEARCGPPSSIASTISASPSPRQSRDPGLVADVLPVTAASPQPQHAAERVRIR